MKHGHSQESFDEFYTSQDSIVCSPEAPRQPKKPRTGRLFDGLVFCLVPGSQKSKVIQRKVQTWATQGAEIEPAMSAKVTHVIVTRDWSFEKVAEYTKSKMEGIAVVRENWVVGSIDSGKLLNTFDFAVRSEAAIEQISQLMTRPVEREPESQPKPKSPKDRFSALFEVTQMAQYTFKLLAKDDRVSANKELASDVIEDRIFEFSSGEGKDLPNQNALAILHAMEHQYSICGDTFRASAYKKAVMALKNFNKPISTAEEAVKIEGIGKNIAERIGEIAETGHLRKWDLMRRIGGLDSIEMFMGVHGVGPATARKWVKERRFETLDDVLNADKQKPFLSSSQKIGIVRYDDFSKRIPRDIVTKHGLVVKNALSEIDPEAEIVIMGSYRRKKASCGDIDIAIIKENEGDSDALCEIRNRLIEKLQLEGFIKARLTEASFLSMDQKWYGASEIKEEPDLWRRIDFFLIPWNERGAAYLHYTGSGMFNRTLRLYARKIKDMRLSEKGLFRRPNKEDPSWVPSQGDLIESEDERKIFEILEVPYRDPENRDFG